MLKNNKRTVIALGYFDSVHTGHQKVIKHAKDVAIKLGHELLVFPFEGNLREYFSGKKESVVLTKAEREQAFYALGANACYFAPITPEFLGKDKRAFLDDIVNKFNVSVFVCGSDYTFGKNAEGNVEYLKNYAIENGLSAEIVELLSNGDKKVSTSNIKELLSLGEIEKANELLGKSYFITSMVKRNRGVGVSLGIPTANLDFGEKQVVKDGVYGGRVVIDGNMYLSVINYGNRPTFDIEEKQIEAHVLDFHGDLYDKEITVYFDTYLRDIVKFNSSEELTKQIQKDVKKIKGE